MSYEQPYAQFREPDVAAIETGGVYYKCYVWQDDAEGSIKAALFTEQHHGQDVLLKEYTVATVGAGLVTQPKIVPCGTAFLVVYVNTNGGNALNRAYLDLTDLHNNGWQTVSSQAIHADLLFDVHTLNSSDSYVWTFKAAGGTATIERFDDVTSNTTAWSQSTADTPINCLALLADASADIAAVVYQKSGTNVLWGYKLDADGANAVTTQVLASYNAHDFTAAGMCLTTSSGLNSHVAVVVEARKSSWTTANYQHHNRMVIYRRMVVSTWLRSNNEHECYNVTLESRPFSYAAGDGSTYDSNVYCVLGFRSTRDPMEWEQTSFFVANLDQQAWSEDTGTVLPIPCANINLGNADTRPHDLLSHATTQTIFKAHNHIPSWAVPPSFGPNVKAFTVALPTFAKLQSYDPGSTVVPSALQPIHSRVTGYIFHPEEPWLYQRDGRDPGAPSANQKFAYPWAQHQNTEIGHCLVFGGGTPSTFDGRAAVEVGYCWFPEIVTTTEATGGNLETSGDYSWTVVAEWRDARGQLHRSAPATPWTEDSLGGSTTKVTLKVRCINLTMRENHRVDHPKIDLVPYRTTNGGSTYYRLVGESTITVGSTPTNDVHEAWVDIADTYADSDVEANDLLSWQFLNGAWNSLVPEQPPANPVCATWKNRAWLAGGEEPGAIWYSMEVLPEPGGRTLTPPEFSSTNVYRLDDGTEQITAMHPMDHALIVFSRDRIYAMTGLGNNNAGLGSTLDHQVIAVGTGCIEPRSVVLGPDGLFFQSEKGYYLLTRTLELDYLSAGADVEDIFRNAGNVRSATLMADRHQVRIVLNEAVEANPRVLIFDYLWRAWSRVTFVGSVHATAWQAQFVDGIEWHGREGETSHVVLAGTGLLVERADDSSAYKDSDTGGTSPVPVAVQTGWINMAGISGFKRVRSILVQVEKTDATALSFDIDYEIEGKYDASNTQTVTIASPAPGGIRLRPNIQKCSAIRLKIYEANDVAETENIKINSITLEVGLRSGHKRVPDANVAT